MRCDLFIRETANDEACNLAFGGREAIENVVRLDRVRHHDELIVADGDFEHVEAIVLFM